MRHCMGHTTDSGSSNPCVERDECLRLVVFQQSNTHSPIAIKLATIPCLLNQFKLC